MILPIVAYGDPVLREKGAEIQADYPDFKLLIENMFETMYDADGVGLAAPQIGLAIRLFVVDASSFSEEEPALASFKKVFVNPKIVEESGEEWAFKEGCLSIPGIRENVVREERVKLSYMDENFNVKEEVFEGMAARIIQHEYDHIEGVLFVDKINPLKKRMLKGKLQDIVKGNVKVSYRMRFPKK